MRTVLRRFSISVRNYKIKKKERIIISSFMFVCGKIIGMVLLPRLITSNEP